MNRLRARSGGRVPVPPVLVTPPSIVSDEAGVYQEGRTLTVVPGVFTGATGGSVYQWYRNGSPIADATNGFYVLVSGDIDANITVEETVSNPQGTASGVSAAVGPILAGPTAPEVVTAPSIVSDDPGVYQVGRTLTVVAGDYNGDTAGPTYQWRRNGVAISGATNTTYLLVTADADDNITVTETVSNAYGSTSSTSAAVGPVLAAADPPGDNDSRLSNARIDETGTYLVFDVSSGTWTGLLQVNPDLIAITMTTASVTSTGSATTQIHTRRAGYRAEYAAGVLKIWLRQGISSNATGVSVTMDAGAVSGPSATTGVWTGSVSQASNARTFDAPKGRLIGLVQGRTDLRYAHDVLDSTFYIEAWGAHSDGIAAVKFEATVGATTVTHWVTEQTRSRYQDTRVIDNTQWTANAGGGSQGGIGVYSSPAIAPSELPEGTGTITVTFYSKNGGLSNSRAHSWPFCNSLGGYTQRIRYVDTVSGSDSNDGLTPGTAYLTPGKGVYHVGAASGGASAKSIGIVYLIGGTAETPRRIAAPTYIASGSTYYSQATDTWVTLEPAPGYDKETVVIIAGGQSRCRRLRFRNMLHDCANGSDSSATGASVLTSNNDSVYPTASNPAALALDNVTTYHHLGRQDQLTSTTSSVLTGSYTGCLQFWMNWEHTDTVNRGFVSNGIDTLRNCYIHAITSDGAVEPECSVACIWEDNKVPTYGLGGLSLINGTLTAGTTVTGLLSTGVSATVASIKSNGAILETGGTVAYAFKRDDNGTHQEVVVSGVTGTFTVGETLRNSNSSQTGVIRAISGTTLRVSMVNGSSFSGTVIGVTSAATATVSSSTTRGNIFFSNGVTAKLNLPHPDGVQLQRFYPQQITVENVVGTFVANEQFTISGVTWSGTVPRLTTLDDATHFTCNSGNQILWYSAYRGRTLTGVTSGATATIVRVDHVSNDANLIFHNCAFRDIDGQIFFGENGAKGVLVTNCYGIRPDATSPSLSKATSVYAINVWHSTLANQPWGRLDTNPIANDTYGDDFVFNIVSTLQTSYVPSGAASDDRGGSPGYDHYGNHQLQAGIYGAAYGGSTTGQVAWVNGVSATQDYDATKTDYRPASDDTVCGLIPAGEVRVKYDFYGVERANDGTETVGAFARAS
jgi:hypothetical protein